MQSERELPDLFYRQFPLLVLSIYELPIFSLFSGGALVRCVPGCRASASRVREGCRAGLAGSDGSCPGRCCRNRRIQAGQSPSRVRIRLAGRGFRSRLNTKTRSPRLNASTWSSSLSHSFSTGVAWKLRMLLTR